MSHYLPEGLPRPSPAPDGLDTPFWEGLRQEDLRLQRCQDCGGWQWGPEWICHRCLSDNVGYESLPAKGTIYSINPAIIIVLVPLVTSATTNVDPLVMIHVGSYISAASVFALATSTSIAACIIFVTVLSIGEAIWSPRLYDYTMQVCPEGREGTYMALSSAPLPPALSTGQV